MTTQIEDEGNKTFDDVNRNNVSRDDVNRVNTVHRAEGLNYFTRNNYNIICYFIVIKKELINKLNLK